MIKRLDKFILGAFSIVFFIVTFVVVFIFLIHWITKYIDELVGKDIGFGVLAELFFYISLNILPFSLPLAVLLAALMTFGNLGEHNELTAIKSSGISLLRIIAPVFTVVVLLCIGVFFFNDKVVPYANLKAYSLLYDVRQKKPALDFKEGAFYNGLPGYSVKVSKKYPDGKSIKGVMIYDHTSGKGNSDLIIADSGSMYMFNHDTYLALELYNGISYSEYTENTNHLYPKQFVRNEFDKSKMVFSLASFALNKTDESLFKTNRLMRNVNELYEGIDSMKKEKVIIAKALPENIKPFYFYTRIGQDSSGNVVKPDTTLNADISYQDIELSKRKMILSRAVNQARSIKTYTSNQVDRINSIQRDINVFGVSLHQKFTQAIACLVMFLIGAPLGAIIKKGGFGVPVLISILFFIIYYVLTITGEKWAKEGITDIVFGLWLPNMVLLPMGLFFLRQAKNDSRVLEPDAYNNLILKIKKLFKQENKA